MSEKADLWWWSPHNIRLGIFPGSLLGSSNINNGDFCEKISFEIKFKHIKYLFVSFGKPAFPLVEMRQQFLRQQHLEGKKVSKCFKK